MKTTFIYTLSDPRNKSFIYVGKTSRPFKRFNEHLKRTNNKTKKNDWIKKLEKLGLKPIYKIIDEIPESEWQFWEEYWISQFRIWGFNILNGTNGGDGGNTYQYLTDNKKNKIIENAKLNLSNYWKGKKFTKEHRDNISKSQSGRTQTDESNLLRSKKLKGRVSPNKGNSYNEEQRKKLGDAHRKVICVLDKDLNIIIKKLGYEELSQYLNGNKNHISNCRLYKKMFRKTYWIVLESDLEDFINTHVLI